MFTLLNNYSYFLRCTCVQFIMICLAKKNSILKKMCIFLLFLLLYTFPLKGYTRVPPHWVELRSSTLHSQKSAPWIRVAEAADKQRSRAVWNIYELVLNYLQMGTRLCRCRWWAWPPRRQTRRQTPAWWRWGWSWLWPESLNSALLCSCHPGCSRANTQTVNILWKHTLFTSENTGCVPALGCDDVLGSSDYTIPLSVLRTVVCHCCGAILRLIEYTSSLCIALGRHALLHFC